jgi:TRAP-type mannitol/chloroaromatic compound transport system substrate-binding protein
LRRPARVIFQHLASGTYADLSQTNAHFKKLYDRLVTFRGDLSYASQVAELPFDSFMMRMRTQA